MIFEGVASKVFDVVVASLMAGMGGAAAYVFDLHDLKDKPISPKGLGIRTFLAVTVGIGADDFLPQDFAGRGGLIMILGFSSLMILGMLKKYGPELVKKWLDKFVPN